MSTDVKKHTSIAPGETPSRAGLAAMILSIKDPIAVANATARAQLISDLTTAGLGPSATNPVVVARADAPGLHRIEFTLDGNAWVSTSGRPFFANTTDANSFAASFSSLLSVNDRCLIGPDEYTWSGTGWLGPGAIVPSGSYTWSPNSLYRSGNMVTALAYPSKASDFGTSEVAGVIPAGFRPFADWAAPAIHFTAGFGPNSGFMQVTAATGEVRVNLSGIAGMRSGYLVGTWRVH